MCLLLNETLTSQVFICSCQICKLMNTLLSAYRYQKQAAMCLQLVIKLGRLPNVFGLTSGSFTFYIIIRQDLPSKIYRTIQLKIHSHTCPFLLDAAAIIIKGNHFPKISNTYTLIIRYSFCLPSGLDRRVIVD